MIIFRVKKDYASYKHEATSKALLKANDPETVKILSIISDDLDLGNELDSDSVPSKFSDI